MAFVVSSGSLVTTDRPASLNSGYSVQVSQYVTESYAQLYRRQSHVRTVVWFLARNVAQLGLHLFERVSDTDRRRVTDHPMARLIGRPNPFTTRYRMFEALMSDLAIYHMAYWYKTTSGDGRPAVVRLNPRKTWPAGDSIFAPEMYEYRGSRGTIKLDPRNVVCIHGYDPDDDRVGCSPLESLRRTLAEEYAAGEYRDQVFRNGGRFSGYLKRPLDAPKWGFTAKENFRADWQSQYTALGPRAGGTPILEDGMDWVQASQTAEALQYIEGRKLTREEVAAAYFIPPPLIGILDHATFSNIAEQHKHLYQDTLGPWLVQIQEELALQLLPDLADEDSGLYLEFNLEAKLRGSFEEQAAQLQTAVGAPWLTRNEARARQNLPALDGADELIVPLNVLEGDQASPSDSGSQNLTASRKPAGRAGPPWVETGLARVFAGEQRKARAPREIEDAYVETLRKFFARQARVIKTVLGVKSSVSLAGVKAVAWWDDERWNAELSEDLYALALQTSETVARSVLDQIGIEPDVYDVERTKAFLRAVADRVAASVNVVTRDQVEAALGDAEDPDAAVSGVFAEAEDTRSLLTAVTLVTTVSGFATLEAGRQTERGEVTKTWLTGPNPRPSHAAMSGETVGIEEPFSNGAMWPADGAALDVDEIAGCNCDVEITVP